jgi:hypothetical protein
MSSGCSSDVMCENHKHNFRIGFQHQNKGNMIEGTFLSCDSIVKGNTGLVTQITKDIGGYFVSNTNIYLRELLPTPCNLLDYNFIIDNEEHVFFEIITQHGMWKNPTEFIKSKIDFHKHNNKDFKWNIDSSKHVLILVYNGADSVIIGRIFRKLCSLNDVRGTIAHISYDTISHWDLLLQIEEWRRTTLQILEQPDDNDDNDGTIFESIFDLNEYLLQTV